MIKEWFKAREGWLFAAVIFLLIEAGLVALLFELWNPDYSTPISIRIFFSAADGILILIPIGMIRGA